MTLDRAGEVLAIRFPVAPGEEQILEGVEPEAMGLRFELVRDRALKQLLWWLDPLLWIAGAGAVVAAVRPGGSKRRGQEAREGGGKTGGKGGNGEGRERVWRRG